jgi:hypothetical protein
VQTPEAPFGSKSVRGLARDVESAVGEEVAFRKEIETMQPEPDRTTRLAAAALAAAVLALSACKSVGPPRVVQDRFDYAEAISRSWKENMLLNIVKMRYADAPIFLDVSSVVAQYSLQGQVSAGGQFPGLGGVNTASVGGQMQWADRPTITLQPLTGHRMTKSLLTPIAPREVMGLVQAGWPVDVVMRGTVRSINGVSAGTRNRLVGQVEDPQFERLLDALRELQQDGSFAVRVESRGGEEVALVVISRDPTGRLDAQRRLVAEILHIDPQAEQYHLVFGGTNASKDEIALLTRSVIQILGDFAFDVDVPPGHQADGRVGPPVPEALEKQTGFHVSSGTRRPDQAFAAVRYEDHWFWIDDRDFTSKRVLSFMMVLLALSETGDRVEPPALTISTGQ